MPKELTEEQIKALYKKAAQRLHFEGKDGPEIGLQEEVFIGPTGAWVDAKVYVPSHEMEKEKDNS